MRRHVFAGIRLLGWRARMRLVAFGLVVLMGACLVLGRAPWCAWRAYVEPRWPVVLGRVQSVDVQRRNGRRTLPRHEVHVAYAYTVAGVAHVGSQWAAGHALWSWTEERAQERARELAPGTPVVVHHDPDDPAEAVLALEAGDDVAFSLAVGAVCLVLGVFGLRRALMPPPSRF